MKTLAILAAASIPAVPALAQGGCVGRVLLPPVDARSHVRVLEAPGRIERVYLPGRVERHQTRTLVRPARVEVRRWGAVWRTERSWIAVGGPVRYERGPDRVETVAQQVVVQPGHYVWERRYAPVVSAPPQPGQTVVSPTGLVMCRIWCPARYATVEREVRVPGEPVAIPTARHRLVVRRVLVRAPGEARRVIPAVYRVSVSSRVVSPGHWVLRRTAARYGWRETGGLRDGGAGWAPVVCGGPLSRSAMARMQASLDRQGYDAGPADGIGRPETYAALHRFQVDHRLAAGQVTVQSAQALGVIAPQP